MSFSKESRYRNIATPTPYYQPRGGRRIPPGYFLAGAVALIALLCCACGVLLLGVQFGPPLISSLTGPTATPTVNLKAPVPLKTKGLADNGVELTVTGVERPLKVEGQVTLPPNYEFMLVTVHLHNTKKTGAPIKIAAADFTVKGDGGLTYPANPKTVTIPQLLTQADLPPNGNLDGELIFQIASNDSGLKLYWHAGKSTREFLLKAQP